MKKQLSQSIYNKFVGAMPVLPDYISGADLETIRTVGLPWLQLQVPVPTKMILQEIQAIQHLMICHRDANGESWGWHSFAIHGKAWDATREDEHYNDDRPHVWTDRALELMPHTVEYFRTEWPAGQYARIRIMLLEPGGFINVHQDADQPVLGPINIAITQPDNCHFVMAGQGTVPYQAGQAFWLDVSHPHIVQNNSTQNRFHIIIHQEFDARFAKAVDQSYKILYNKAYENLSNS